MKTLRYLALAALLVASGSVVAEPIEIRLGDETFELDVVDDQQSREKGLMGRESLGENEGMIFDFPKGSRPAIWMRNMVISLDLLFLDEQGTLVQIFHRVPPCEAMPCEVYQAERPLRFVIEVAAGTANRLGLEPGQQVDLGTRLATPVPAF
jgi:uncharacterized membrane protein (UPF0127 family)